MKAMFSSEKNQIKTNEKFPLFSENSFEFHESAVQLKKKQYNEGGCIVTCVHCVPFKLEN